MTVRFSEWDTRPNIKVWQLLLIPGSLFSLFRLAILYQSPSIGFTRDRFNISNAAILQTPAQIAVNNLTPTVGTHAAQCISHGNCACAAQPEATGMHREKKMLLLTTGFDIYLLVINSIE
jgi:hypothetical protein